ncbi:MAG: uracil phosphoribosyltransferase, partial [Parachlamydiaceae bacterium]
GLAMLYPFLRVFDRAKVGFFGMRRDETTHEAKLYYENLPEIKKGEDVIVLDPMLATGGSAFRALSILTARGVDSSNLYYVGMVAAPEGLEKIKEFPITTVIASIDERLNENKFIVPGLGDFGDRYFGTE